MSTKSVLETVQERLRTWPQWEVEEHAKLALRELERLPHDVVTTQVLALATLLCLRDETVLAWALNGTPRVVTVTASENLNTKDYAG